MKLLHLALLESLVLSAAACLQLFMQDAVMHPELTLSCYLLTVECSVCKANKA